MFLRLELFAVYCCSRPRRPSWRPLRQAVGCVGQLLPHPPRCGLRSLRSRIFFGEPGVRRTLTYAHELPPVSPRPSSEHPTGISSKNSCCAQKRFQLSISPPLPFSVLTLASSPLLSTLLLLNSLTCNSPHPREFIARSPSCVRKKLQLSELAQINPIRRTRPFFAHPPFSLYCKSFTAHDNEWA